MDVYFSLLFLLVVNSIRGLYPKDTHEWLTWIQKNKALYLNKEKVQALIDQQRRNPADVNYLDLDLISKIVRDFQNASGEFENSSRNSVSPEADVTETAPFKNWFGDSKVVDESGKPLEVYHGTNWDGWEFDTENGAFFSEKEDYAEEMAAQRGGSRIVKAYLSIRNPLVVEVPGNKMADPEFEARIIAEAKSKGHDGVKLETDTNNEIEKDVFWVAFEPNQIKSATDNVGTFDPGNHDVRFSVAPDDAFVQAWAKVLLPVVSTQYINVDGAAAYLMDHGIEVYAGRDDDTLRKACVLAQTWKKERNKVVRGNREHKALEKKDPYYKILSGKFGRDFQINAGPKYDGTVFTGTWMDKHKTEKGRSGGISAAEAAKILTESTGKEVTEAVVVWWNRQGGR